MESNIAMRKYLYAIAILLTCATPAWAQCGGVFQPGTVCGNLGASPAPPKSYSTSGILTPFKVPVRSSGNATVTASATTDYYFCLDPTGNAITLNLPAAPTTGLSYEVKDCTGQAGTNRITVQPASGTIDGSSALIMSSPYQSVQITYTGTQWSLLPGSGLATYAGPGDVRTGATAWYGLRAYSNSQALALFHAAQLRRAGGFVVQDINLTAAGNFDTAAANTFGALMLPVSLVQPAARRASALPAVVVQDHRMMTR